MNNYGLRLRDENGAITLDNFDLIARVRYTTVALSGSSGNVVLSDISGKTTELFSMIINWDDAYTPSAPHSVSRSGTTIIWTEQTGVGVQSATSLICVLLRD